MSEIKHTAEPWAYEHGNGHYSGSIVITSFAMSAKSPLAVISDICGDAEDDARRIVACVNACKEIPTEWLESNGAYAVPVPSLRTLLNQRDELLAALKQAEGFVEGYVGEGFGDDFDSPTLEIIRNAIAKSEGKL